MCRHLGYLGPARTLSSLLYEGEHSMERQSYAPRMTQGNLLNADGFGIGWYEDDGGARRFRRGQPIWTDVSFREVADVIRAGCAVAALRSATSGFPVDESCAQPFRAGTRLFSHNGKVEGFAGVESKLRELAGDLAEVPDARAPVDSALLFAFAARLWREGVTLGDGLAEVVRSVSGLAPGRYNLLASDGTTLAATTWGDSLFVRTTGEAIWLASEPVTEEAAWETVPERSLVTAGLASGVHVYPL
ncbi:ergothioneine biosynthesis protein EgtC [Actinomadura sp. 6N118]|uniref:ergothioneine biosynthesis protein EgtC n=1 Tax=Actinomadura sp. 6N118 TaxID=3375151 RepID=UPI0037BCF299